MSTGDRKDLSRYVSRLLGGEKTNEGCDILGLCKAGKRDVIADVLGHEDLTAAASAISPETERQAGSVFATAQQQITDLFVSDFAESGDFSIREYMDDPDGRVLVLDYPTRQSGTIAPVFRYLIDQAIMHGMDDPDRSVYYLLNEIEHLDATIKRLGKLINVGRGVNCQSIISLQSMLDFNLAMAGSVRYATA